MQHRAFVNGVELAVVDLVGVDHGGAGRRQAGVVDPDAGFVSAPPVAGASDQLLDRRSGAAGDTDAERIEDEGLRRRDRRRRDGVVCGVRDMSRERLDGVGCSIGHGPGTLDHSPSPAHRPNIR